MGVYKEDKSQKIRTRDKFSLKKNEQNGLYTLMFPKSSASVLGANLFVDTQKISAYLFQELVVPSTIVAIENNCFSNCSNLERVVLPNTLTSIGKACFKRCKKLKSIKISEGLSVLPEYFLNSCSSLKEITIPEGVHTIKEGCFCLCSGLVKVNIPTSVTVIENSAFYGCTSLEEFSFNDDTICINDDLFNDCVRLKNVKLPSKLKKIGNKSFLNCAELQEVDFPEQLRVIDDYAFEDCSSLKSIVIPPSVSRIGQCAFENCTGLEEVTILSNNHSKRKLKVQEGAFSGCQNLRKITLPKGVLDEAVFDFDNMPNLKTLVYAGKTIFNLSENEVFNKLLYNGRYIYVEYMDKSGKTIVKVIDENSISNDLQKRSTEATSQFIRLFKHEVFGEDLFKYADEKTRICLNMLSVLNYGTCKKLLDLLLEREKSGNFGFKKDAEDKKVSNKDNSDDNKQEAEKTNPFVGIKKKVKENIEHYMPFLKKHSKESDDSSYEKTSDFITLSEYLETLFINVNVKINIANYTRFFYTNLFEISNISSQERLQTLSKVQFGFDEILMKSLRHKRKLDTNSLTLDDALQCSKMVTITDNSSEKIDLEAESIVKCNKDTIDTDRFLD